MVDPKYKYGTATPKTASLSKLYDVIDENFLKTVDEICTINK